MTEGIISLLIFAAICFVIIPASMLWWLTRELRLLTDEMVKLCKEFQRLI